jgi:hypothetical protein
MSWFDGLTMTTGDKLTMTTPKRARPNLVTLSEANVVSEVEGRR